MKGRCVLAALLLGALAFGQGKQPAPPPLVEDEATHQLLLDRDVFRVYRLEVPPGQEVQLHRHGNDYVEIALADFVEATTGPGAAAASWEARAGDARFVAGGFAHRVKNAGASTLRELIIEIKRHWRRPVVPCAAFSNCVRPIGQQGTEFGEMTSLFSSGFLTGYRYHLVKGGTLSSSYYSRTGKDRVILVPLTALRVSFSGTQERLQSGVPYYSDAPEVEVDAQEAEARWVVIRVSDKD